MSVHTLSNRRTTLPELNIATASERRHPLRWAGAAVMAVLLAQLGHMVLTNPRFEWGTVAAYFRASSIMQGLAMTIGLTLVAMLIGCVLGVVMAACRLSDNPLLSATANAYIWFFRGTPTLVQLIFFYNLAALLPSLSLGIPFGPEFVTFETNDLITPVVAAILGLGLNEGAYMAEIIRGGIISVDQGQREAGHSLGMTAAQTMRRIILPQAMRFIVPPTGNQVISMVKATSLVSVIALADILYTAQSIYNRTFETIPLLIVVCIWYLIVTSILYVGQSFLEQHYGRSVRRTTSRAGLISMLRIRPKVTQNDVPTTTGAQS